MTTCELCGALPAAVFRPTVALCKPCKRSLDFDESHDNEVPNGPTCATCGGVLGRGGCVECYTRSVVSAHAQMARVS